MIVGMEYYETEMVEYACQVAFSVIIVEVCNKRPISHMHDICAYRS